MDALDHARGVSKTLLLNNLLINIVQFTVASRFYVDLQQNS